MISSVSYDIVCPLAIEAHCRLSTLIKLKKERYDARLLEILVCPLCKGPLIYKKDDKELICKLDRLAYPIKDGIPVMLAEDARRIPDDVDIK